MLNIHVRKNELKTYRGAGVKRTLITAIECISVDGRYLHPLIIWPAAIYRSTWTTHPTQGWQFGHSDSGYTDTAISLYWIQHIFDPLTKARALPSPLLSPPPPPPAPQFVGPSQLRTKKKKKRKLLYPLLQRHQQQ